MNYDQLIFDTAIDDGMPQQLALFIVAQARHETGNYTSNFFKKYNNAFGYSYFPGSRWQSGAGTTADNGLPIAAYTSVDRSVHELTDWIKRRQNEGKFPADLNAILSPEYYSQLLKSSGYYGATLQTYTAGILAALQKIGKLTISATGGTLLLVLVLAAIFRKQIFK